MKMTKTKHAEKRPRRRKSTNPSQALDRWLMGGILGVAAAAAAFPWYVFFNQEKFSVNIAGWESLRNLPQGHGGGVAPVFPHEEQQNAARDQDFPSLETTDPVTTATVSALGTEAKEGALFREEQPIPGTGTFRLLHVANGRALIEDKSGIFLVQVGSVLPDNTRLATLRQRDGKWEIITSAGTVYSE